MYRNTSSVDKYGGGGTDSENDMIAIISKIL